MAKPVDPERWMHAYGDYLFRYAISRLRSADAAEDVLQETMLAGLQAVSRFRGSLRSERPWLLAILKSKIVDYIRNRPLGRDATSDPRDLCSTDCEALPASRLQDPHQLLENAHFWCALREGLQRLPQKQADAFVLRELEGLSTDEICEALGVSESNLWVLLHRARLRLAGLLARNWQGDPAR